MRERDGASYGSIGGILTNATEGERGRQTRAVKDDTNESYPAGWVCMMNAQCRANI